MICPECKRETPDNIPNCIYCGYVFKQNDKIEHYVDVFSSARVQIPEELIVKHREEEKRQRKYVLIILVILSIALILGTVIATSLRYTQQKKESNTYVFSKNLYYDVCNDIQEIEADSLGEDLFIEPEQVPAVIEKVADYIKEEKKKGSVTYFETTDSSVYFELKDKTPVVFVPKVRDHKIGKGGGTVLVQPFDNDTPEQYAERYENSAKAVAKAYGAAYSFKDSYQIKNGAVDLEAAKTFSNATLLLWDGHGGYSTKTHSFLIINDDFAKLKQKYPRDCSTDTLRIIGTTDGGAAITCNFINRYYNGGDFDGAVVYLGACCSAMDDKLAGAFIKKGAACVYGNSSLVSLEYDSNFAQDVLTSLAAGETAQDALDDAVDRNGVSENWIGLRESKVVLNGKGETKLNKSVRKQSK